MSIFLTEVSICAYHGGDRRRKVNLLFVKSFSRRCRKHYTKTRLLTSKASILFGIYNPFEWSGWVKRKVFCLSSVKIIDSNDIVWLCVCLSRLLTQNTILLTSVCVCVFSLLKQFPEYNCNSRILSHLCSIYYIIHYLLFAWLRWK